MADVAVISVIASGTVGVLGAAPGFYGQRVTLRNEREKRVEARLEELRGVLDGAARLGLISTATNELPGTTFGSVVADVQRLLPELRQLEARVSVRVGTDHAVAKSFDGFVCATFNALNAAARCPRP